LRKQAAVSDKRICAAELERPTDIRDELHAVARG